MRLLTLQLARCYRPPHPKHADKHSMEPMRLLGDYPNGYESGAIKVSSLLSAPTIESVVFGVTLHWNPKSVSAFVEVASTESIAERPPVWISQPRGHLTEQAFKSDVMAYLAVVAGGLVRDNDLAPNTMQQHWNITKRLGHIENDPFVQACMSKLDADNAYLAAVLVRYECPGFGVQPAAFDPPPLPHRQVFH